VRRVTGLRQSQSGLHEGFLLQIARPPILVEDNAGITGTIPLKPHDRVALQGQYECNDGVIHWTHRDPRFHHPAGYIEVNGKRYQ